MASKKRERKTLAPSGPPASGVWDRLASPHTISLGLAVAVLPFYFKPLFSSSVVIQWQLALHCLLAAMGGYLLGRDLLRSRAAAVFAGLCFAFSGVFAEHSSHLIALLDECCHAGLFAGSRGGDFLGSHWVAPQHVAHAILLDLAQRQEERRVGKE